MVNNNNNNPQVFDSICGEHSGRYISYSYMNQDGSSSSCCDSSFLCSDFVSNVIDAAKGIGTAYVESKYGVGTKPAGVGQKPTSSGGTTGGGTNTKKMTTSQKVLIGTGIVGGVALIATVIYIVKKKK